MSLEALAGGITLDLPEFDAPPPDPIALLRAWLEQARHNGVREPAAFVLATADTAGVPSSRVVTLKEIDATGLVFTTHAGSRKGRDLAARPYASASFYWRETLQQITVAGAVQVLSDVESDALFAERPTAAQVTTAVSRQSQTLDDEAALRTAADALLADGEPIRRPSGWCGYRLEPDRVEFWHGSIDRLHRRMRYDHTEDGTWNHQRLQP